MNIYAKEGTLVTFNGKGGYPSDLEHANSHLNVGNTYTIDYTDVGGWHTDVYLKEFPNKSFNSVHFDDESDAPITVATDNIDSNTVLNINEAVSVKLTELGMKIFKNDFNSSSDQSFTFDDKLKLYMNDEGYIRFQLWELMNIFGSHLFNGSAQVFVNNNISIIKTSMFPDSISGIL